MLGILLAVVLAVEWGSPTAVIAAGGTAAIAGTTALQDNPHDRMPAVLGVSAAAGVAVFLGTLTAPHGLWFTAVVVMWSIGAGLLWAVNASTALVAAAITALLISSAHQPTSSADAALTAALAVTGGLTQAVLVAAWPAHRWQAQQAALADAYRSVAAGARELAADPEAALDVAPLFTLRDTYTMTERQARRRPPAFRGLFGLPERIAMTLTALRANSSGPSTQALILAAADALDAITGSSRTARSDAGRALSAIDAAVGHVPNAAVLSAHRLQTQLREAVSLRFTGSTTPLRRVAAGRASVRSQLHWNSPVLRHAVRLGAAAGVGTAAAALTGMAQGYWMALTVLLVLRPETAHTYTRCVIRVGGTLVGIVIATSITVLTNPGWAMSAVLAVLFVGIAYAISGISYVPVTATLAATVVFLVDVTGGIHADTLRERLVATIIGGALAVAGHVILPDRSLVRLNQRAGELLKAEIDYSATVVCALVRPHSDTAEVIAAAWERAVRARSAFEAASGSTRADNPAVRRWLTGYRAVINAVTGSCAIMESQVPTADPGTLDRRFVVAVYDFVDALRGDTPQPGQAWTLDTTHLIATEQQLRESAAFLGRSDIAARVLVAEAETITRHLLTVTAYT